MEEFFYEEDSVIDDDIIKSYSDSLEDTISLYVDADYRNFNNELLINSAFICDGHCVIGMFGRHNILKFKDIIESRKIVMYNAKNILPLLYTIDIKPLNTSCIFVNEQLFNLGIKDIDLGLNKLTSSYLGLNLDYDNKSELIKSVFDIYKEQMKKAEDKGMLQAISIESSFIPALAYFKWCGFKMDYNIWEEITSGLSKNCEEKLNMLNEFVFNNIKNDSKVCIIDMQGDLFEGFKNEKRCFIKWNNPDKVNDFINNHKFFIENPDKIDEIKSLYDDYNRSLSLIKMYGKNYVESRSPITGRIHPQYNQLTSEGRVSSPIKTKNQYGGDVYLASAMNLPKEYRKSIIPEDGNIFISGDWTACEIGIIAHLSNDKSMIDIFNSCDIHEYIAKKFNISRDDAKTLSFQIIYCATDESISKKLGISVSRCSEFIKSYANMFPSLVKFIKSCISKPIDIGYVPMFGYGYRQNIYDIEKLRMTSKMFSPQFWKSYSKIKDNPNDLIVKDVKYYFKRKGDLERISINSKAQNGESIMFKLACSMIFKWIVKNNYFGKVKMVIPLHDSITLECPEDMKNLVTEKLLTAMNLANSKVCPKASIKVKINE